MPWSGSNDIPDVVDDRSQPPKLPAKRIRDGWHANAIFRTLLQDDSEADAARANIDAQIDGEAPYSRSVMEAAGRGEDANVNFREARAEDDLAQAPFVEMSTVSPVLWRIKTSVGNEEDRSNWSRTISEKFSKMVRAWGGDFDYYRLRLSQQFTRHGAGFVYWEDEFNWQWRSDGLNNFKLPRDTESRASAIPYCVCKRTMTTVELYEFIRNEKEAREVGRWNVDAVKAAILNAATTDQRNIQDYAWEDFMREVKENDIECGRRNKKIFVFHLWACEYDGTISHYIALQTGVAAVANIIIAGENGKGTPAEMLGDGFLYAHRQRFPYFEAAIVPFYYSIGTHATVHTIRAQGEMNFAPIGISNRAMCNLIDTAKASSMILLQAETPNDAENFAYIQVGGFMIVPANAKVQPNAMPDVSGRVLPVLNEMRALRQQVSPNASAQPPTGPSKGKQPETKYSIQAKQNRGGTLSSAMLTQWFGPFGRVGKEMYRRVMAENVSDLTPGGKEAMIFRKECLELGVPPEAMKFENCEIDAVRVIGNGSPEARQYASEQVLELSEGFDEYGQKKARLDCVASIPGVDWQQAEDYVGPLTPRQPIDAQIANGENSLFTLGAPAKVTGEQNHWVHCQIHEELVKETQDQFNQGQIDGQKLVLILKPALDNMLQHSEILSKDKNREKESAQVRKFIQSNNGTLEQQENKLIAEMQRQQQQPQPGQNGSQMGQRPQDDKQAQLAQMDIAKKKQELENRQREFEQRMAIQQAEAHARMRMADIKAARDTAIQTAELVSEPL